MMQEDPVEQFRYLGLRRIVYLKAGMLNGERAFVIYSADGIALEVVDAMDTALEKVALSGFSLVAVH
jgi:hypothetical protein